MKRFCWIAAICAVTTIGCGGGHKPASAVAQAGSDQAAKTPAAGGVLLGEAGNKPLQNPSEHSPDERSGTAGRNGAASTTEVTLPAEIAQAGQQQQNVVADQVGARALPVQPAAAKGAPDTSAQSPAADTIAAVVKRIEQLQGTVEYDDAKNLVGVNLIDCGAGDEDLALLASIPTLKKLSVSGAKITDAGVEHISKMTGLVELVLQNTDATNAGIAKLVALKNLRLLNLQRTSYMTDDALAVIAKMPSIQYLEVLYNNIGNDALKHIGQMKQLRSLDIRGCVYINNEGLEHITGLNNLRALRLRQTVLGDEGLQKLAALPNLINLWIEDALISDDGLAVLPKLANLEDLTIFRCSNVTDEGLKHLKPLQKLRQLNLRDLSINGSGLAHITGAKGLRRLNLSETAIDDAALEHVAQLHSLAWLDLWHTQVTDSGMAALARLKSLQYLRLTDTAVGDAGMEHLAKLPALETLDLELTKVTDKSIEYLKQLPTLKRLVLTQSQMTEKGVEQLRKALPKCQIVF